MIPDLFTGLLSVVCVCVCGGRCARCQDQGARRARAQSAAVRPTHSRDPAADHERNLWMGHIQCNFPANLTLCSKAQLVKCAPRPVPPRGPYQLDTIVREVVGVLKLSCTLEAMQNGPVGGAANPRAVGSWVRFSV